MALPPPILPRPLAEHPRRQADTPMPVLRHGSPPAQRTLPLRRAP